MEQVSDKYMADQVRSTENWEKIGERMKEGETRRDKESQESQESRCRVKRGCRHYISRPR